MSQESRLARAALALDERANRVGGYPVLILRWVCFAVAVSVSSLFEMASFRYGTPTQLGCILIDLALAGAYLFGLTSP